MFDNFIFMNKLFKYIRIVVNCWRKIIFPHLQRMSVFIYNLFHYLVFLVFNVYLNVNHK
jgi:hypothetical protein